MERGGLGKEGGGTERQRGSGQVHTTIPLGWTD